MYVAPAAASMLSSSADVGGGRANWLTNACRAAPPACTGALLDAPPAAILEVAEEEAGLTWPTRAGVRSALLGRSPLCGFVGKEYIGLLQTVCLKQTVWRPNYAKSAVCCCTVDVSFTNCLPQSSPQPSEIPHPHPPPLPHHEHPLPSPPFRPLTPPLPASGATDPY